MRKEIVSARDRSYLLENVLKKIESVLQSGESQEAILEQVTVLADEGIKISSLSDEEIAALLN
jgi:hypothetical protein